MKLVVKIGGAALDNKELVKKFAAAIPGLCQEGHKSLWCMAAAPL